MRDLITPFAIVPVIPNGHQLLHNAGFVFKTVKDPSGDDMYIVPLRTREAEAKLRCCARLNRMDPVTYVRCDSSAYVERPSSAKRVEVGTFKKITKDQADLTSYFVMDPHSGRYYDVV